MCVIRDVRRRQPTAYRTFQKLTQAKNCFSRQRLFSCNRYRSVFVTFEIPPRVYVKIDLIFTIWNIVKKIAVTDEVALKTILFTKFLQG